MHLGLKNDLKDIVCQIKKGLDALHSAERLTGLDVPSLSTTTAGCEQRPPVGSYAPRRTSNTPFLLVDEVTLNSPADYAVSSTVIANTRVNKTNAFEKEVGLNTITRKFLPGFDRS